MESYIGWTDKKGVTWVRREDYRRLSDELWIAENERAAAVLGARLPAFPDGGPTCPKCGTLMRTHLYRRASPPQIEHYTSIPDWKYAGSPECLEWTCGSCGATHLTKTKDAV